MAIVFVSPGVFDREIDETSRPADTVGTGPAIIGPRAKGPAMEPVLLRDLDDDQAVFGVPDKDGGDFAAYASRLYLRQATTPLTFIRLLGMEDTGVTPGYSVGGTYAILASGSNVVALIHSSGAVTLQGTLTASASEVAIAIPGFNSDVAVTASLYRSDSTYIKKVLNTDPTQYSTKKHYVFAVYDFANKTPGAGMALQSVEVAAASAYTDGFITGSTTAVKSQPFGVTEYDLFGVGSRLAGDSANEEIKVSISDIKKSPNPDQYEYGSFTVVVRQFNDNDRSPRVLESFPNCNLDPNSPNYVVRRIGDRYKVWNFGTKKFDYLGEYVNRSKYIYLTPSTDLKNGNVPATALPFGFSGYRRLSNGAVGGAASFPELPYVSNLLYKGSFTQRVHWGVEVVNNFSGALNHGVPDRLKHLASAALAASGTVDSSFSLKYLSASVQSVSGFTDTARLTQNQIGLLSSSIAYSASTAAPTTSGSGGYTGYLSLENIENTDLAKFTLPVADGFDGINIHSSDPFSPEDMASTTAYQTHTYRTALDMLSNPDEHDLSELFLPGVHATNVTNYALDMVEDRADLFYVMDISGSTREAAIADVVAKQLDTNYAAVYYPWLRLSDEVNRKEVDVPPTVVIPAALAYNDRVSFPWFAPAGMNRGGLRHFGVIEAKDKLNKADRDALYENRVNPIASFPGEGPTVWGQKTLQIQPSALDRINVRRMLLRVRKLIAKVGRTILFEPNVARTWQAFENKVNPILERIRADAGVEDFRVILDNRTTTEDLIERNIMYGKIVIKPTRAAEAILLDFHLTNNAAAFVE